MKIVIERSHNEKPIIRSAFVEKNKVGTLLVINTRGRGCFIDASFSSSGSGKLRQIDYHIAQGQSEDDGYDTLTLIPDNKREEKFLDGLAYSLVCKDQIEILIVPWNSLKTLKNLANTFDD